MQPHFRTVGDIRITNALWIGEETMAYVAAMKLLESCLSGLPVLNRSKKVVGKITEIDLLRALKAGKDLRATPAKSIMAPIPAIVSTETPLELAVEIMDTHGLIRLPVVNGGRFVGSVTRHDLLRAWLGVWVERDFQRGGYAEVMG